MKRILLITVLVVCSATIMVAQTEDVLKAEVLKSDAISAETQSDSELAAQTYENAAKAFKYLNITDSLCIYKAGYHYTRINRFEKAVPFLQESINLKYNESRARQLLSNAYIELNDYKKAEDVLLEGKAGIPANEAEFNKELAYLYFNTGQYEKAADYFGKLNESLPGNKNYMYLHGFSLERIKKYDEAISVLEAAQQLFPDDKRAKKVLGIACLEQTEILNAKEVARYESLKKAKIEDYIGTKERLEKINAGYERAKIMLEESLKDFPDDKLVINSLYRIYKKQNNEVKAAQMKKLL